VPRIVHVDEQNRITRIGNDPAETLDAALPTLRGDRAYDQLIRA
jgi:hypothetical protein